MNNLHISLTEFRHESRVLKETQSLIDENIFSHIHIAALSAEKSPNLEQIDSHRTLYRFTLHTKKWPKIFISQMAKYFEFSYRVYKEFKDKKISVINVHSLGLLPLGAFLKWRYKAKLVYDAHELETEVEGLYGFRKKLSQLTEKIFIKQVDLIIVVSQNIANWYEVTYKISPPLVIYNTPFLQPLYQTDFFRDELHITQDQKIALYQGGLFTGRGIEPLLDAFKSRQQNDIVIVFMGYGELQEMIKEMADKYSNIFYYPAVSPDILLQYTASADYGFSLIENTCLSYYYCLPNKLFEYAMQGLPVIGSDMLEMSSFIHQHHIGYTLKNLTIDAINHVLDNLIQEDSAELALNARKASEKNCWEIQIPKMVLTYQEMLKGK